MRSLAWSSSPAACPTAISIAMPPTTATLCSAATGMIAFVFIMLHVFHMHGWFHADVWLENVVKPLGGSPVQALQRGLDRRAGPAELCLGGLLPAWCTLLRVPPGQRLCGRWASPGACGPVRRPKACFGRLRRVWHAAGRGEHGRPVRNAG